MALQKFTLLAIMAVLALSVGDFRPVVGEYNANWKVLNGGGSNNFAIGVKAHCYSQYNDLAPVILQPGQDESYQWEHVPYLNEAYQCAFEVDTTSGVLTQDFYIWKQAGGGYLKDCDFCKWKIQQDGFYFQTLDGTFTKTLIFLIGGPYRHRRHYRSRPRYRHGPYRGGPVRPR